MNIQDKYRFYITLPNDSQPTEFKSAVSSLKWKEEKYKDECFFRKELETELVIDDKDLFVQLYNLHKDKCRCNALVIRIDKCCCEVWTENYHEGVFAFIDGDWNPEKCKVTFKLRDRDEYSCLLREWELEKNFLEIQDRVSVKNIIGDLVCQTIFQTSDINAIPSGFGWTLTRLEKYDETGTNGPSIDYNITYCRQCSPTAIPGWVLENGQYYNSIGVSSVGNTTVVFTGDNDDQTDVEVIITTTTYSVIDLDTDNGIAFKDLIEYFLGDCFPCVVSNFFNINPDGTAPDNAEYQCAVKDFHNIVAFQSFELIAPLSATSIISGLDKQQAGVKKFKDFWTELNKMVPLCMFEDKDTGCLRIEHCSYLEDRTTGNRINLLADSTKKCLIGTGNFKIDPIDIPNSETWKYAVESSQRDFAFSTITYDPDCSNDDIDTKDVEIPIKCFSNDLSRIYRNSLIEENESEINNITLVSTSNGLINSTTGINGEQVLNGAFSLTHLAKYNYRKRPQCQGVVNGTNIAFYSTARIRKPQAITIPLSCKDYESINIEEDTLINYFGECEILSMEREEPSGNVTFVTAF